MELELKHKLLSAGTDPQGGFWRYEAPWWTLSRIGHDLVNPVIHAVATISERSGGLSMGKLHPFCSRKYTYKVELIINQGGIQNRNFNQGDKELFHWAIENIKKVCPEIPNKLTGRMFLHFADTTLKRV